MHNRGLDLTTLIASCRYQFPQPQQSDPDGHGLIAIGADLSPSTLLCAYAHGLFPWFNAGCDIAWWSPDPRCVLNPADFTPSKSLRRTAKKHPLTLTVNQDFAAVISACSQPRSDHHQTMPTDADTQCIRAATNGDLADHGDHDDTWIHLDMRQAYTRLHHMGFAHSIEVLDDAGSLIGGLYGVKLGNLFCGESMFHRSTDASKIAFWGLCHLCQQTGVDLIDCQLQNPHLISLGAITLPRAAFLRQLPERIRLSSRSWLPDTVTHTGCLRLTTHELRQAEPWHYEQYASDTEKVL